LGEEASRPTITDNQLLQRHLDGDGQAFGTLVERYRRPLFTFLVRFTGDAALADDIFQETFLQLHLSAAVFDMSKRLKPWLFTIAANKARDALRSRTRHPAAPLDAALPGGEGEAATYGDLIPGDIPAPDETVLNLETRRIVQNIVNDMPEGFRTVILLCYFHGFSYQDIAEMLNLPLGTVKSRIHTAIKVFAQKWKAAAGRTGHG
jgi:RNA polymerase sigma-70 factor (ECF subfamily)